MEETTGRSAVQDGAGNLLIGEVAEATGVTARAIRYYEEMGLLARPNRSAGDFRLYSEADVARVELIVRLKHLLGFSLSEIRKIVESDEALDHLKDDYRSTADPAKRVEKLDRALELIKDQVTLLDTKLGQIQEMKASLDARLARLEERRRSLVDVAANSGADASPAR